MAFAGFTNFELKVTALHASGFTSSEIAKRLHIGRQLVHNAIWTTCKKAGIEYNPDALTRWAIDWGFDALLEPETSEARPYAGEPKPGAYRRARWPLQDRRP